MKNKRGSTAVILTILFVSMTSAIGSIGEAGSRYAAQSHARAALESAGRSVLASYYSPLKDRYGLFGTQKSEDEIEKEIDSYARDSVSKMPLTKTELLNSSVECSGYALTEQEIFLSQIKEYMKYRVFEENLSGAVEKIASFTSEGKEIDDKISLLQQECDDLDTEAEDLEAEDEDDDGEASEERKKRKKIHEKLRNIKNNTSQLFENSSSEIDGYELNNDRIIESLPSEVESEKFSDLFTDIKGINGLAGTASNIKDSFYVDSYITTMFGNLMTDRENVDEESRDSFFNLETEYIICGKKSDRENHSKIRKYLFCIRFALNTTFLYTDSIKRNETLSLATSITPGFVAPLTQLLIISAWASIESKNDMNILESGGSVPLIKTEESWATDLDDLMEEGLNEIAEALVENGSDNTDSSLNDTEGESEGLDYEGYLQIMLKMVPMKLKLLHMMDLIQINLKGTSSESFVLSECCTGFNLTADLKKKSMFSKILDSSFSINMSHSY